MHQDIFTENHTFITHFLCKHHYIIWFLSYFCWHSLNLSFNSLYFYLHGPSHFISTSRLSKCTNILVGANSWPLPVNEHWRAGWEVCASETHPQHFSLQCLTATEEVRKLYDLSHTVVNDWKSCSFMHRSISFEHIVLDSHWGVLCIPISKFFQLQL